MKKRSLCFKYGNFSAVLFALALGLASCHLEKKTGTAPNSAIKTEDISWEEKEKFINNQILLKKKKEMKKVLSEIQDGTFASEFIQEFNAGGKARFLATRKKEADHLLCKVGAELRNMMSWLKK